MYNFFLLVTFWVLIDQLLYSTQYFSDKVIFEIANLNFVHIKFKRMQETNNPIN
jgi:hypothetical protein